VRGDERGEKRAGGCKRAGRGNEGAGGERKGGEEGGVKGRRAR